MNFNNCLKNKDKAMKKLIKIYKPGDKAHNGHVFTHDDCVRYNRIRNDINTLVWTGQLAVTDVIYYLEDYIKLVFNAIINNKQ